MRAHYLEPAKTPCTMPELALAYYAALGRIIGGSPTPEAVAVLCAHCCLETGNMAICFNNAVGNIKAGEQYAGFFTCYRCNEREQQKDGSWAYRWYSPTGREDPKGTIVAPFFTVPDGHRQTRFRAYEALDDGVYDKIDFLADPNWRPALDFALRGDAAGYVRAIKQRNYFTAELAPYLRSVVSIAGRMLPIVKGVAAELEPDDDATCRDRAECMRTELPDWLRARVEAQTKLLDVDWHDWRKDRDASIRKDSDPTMPGVRLPDTEPPEGAA